MLQIRTNLPSQGRLTLMQQPKQKWYVLHLLYANMILRGGSMNNHADSYIRPSRAMEIIEELNPACDLKIDLKTEHHITEVTLEPQGQRLQFTMQANGRIIFSVKTLECHQMVVLKY